MENILSKIEAFYNWRRVEIEDSLPKTVKDFGWKVRWRMRHDHNPLFIRLQDKYLAKAYAEERGIRAARVLYVTDKPETIPFDSLPGNCFIKANHGCGWNVLCKEHQFFTYRSEVNFRGNNEIAKYKITQTEVIDLCKSWLRKRYSRTQWAYQHIVPKIIVEEYLYPREGTELKDYKLYTFYGKVKLVDVLSPTIRRNREEFLLNTNWQPVDSFVYEHNLSNRIPQKPDTFQELIRTAEILGKELDFARIDLYDTTLGVVLGEITIYPEGGRVNSPAHDRAFNLWLGKQWVLPNLY